MHYACMNDGKKRSEKKITATHEVVVVGVVGFTLA